MSLKEYKQKRNFKLTPEPAGAVTKKPAKRVQFVIQKHAASHLHYDFRLEMAGVLKSWAVPKGPSLNPADKRLAVQVEDHPIGYANFEGEIPPGQYGGGEVIVWDNGVWECEDDPVKSWQAGKLRFTLQGKKLQGKWLLLRMPSFKKNGKTNWLLRKEQDEAADKTTDITAERPESVISGKKLQIDSESSASLAKPKKSTVKKTKIANRKKKSDSITNSPVIAGVTISHPDKIFYPEINLTKLAVAQYYEAIAQWMLPYIKGRPLNVLRCPDGIAGECFFQKHLTHKLPAGIEKIAIAQNDKTIDSFIIKNITGLIHLAQLGVLEFHVWGEIYTHSGKPDQIIFDLDPETNIGWQQIIETALLLKDILTDLDLTSFVKTTGGKGLHIEVPIKPIYTWQQIHNFAKAIANTLVKLNPDLYIATAAKAKRRNKIFIDYLRNSQSATAVAPYSLRARTGAPIATPLTWEEVSKKIPSNYFTINNISARLSKLKKDPWLKFFKLKQTLTKEMLEKIKSE